MAAAARQANRPRPAPVQGDPGRRDVTHLSTPPPPPPRLKPSSTDGRPGVGQARQVGPGRRLPGVTGSSRATEFKLAHFMKPNRGPYCYVNFCQEKITESI